jgi:alkylhydroperoxidase/carboxymuconolactone decarboxylase family protein YurZ
VATKPPASLTQALAYSRGYYRLKGQGPIRERKDRKDTLGWEVLARYRPEVLEGYLGLRQAAFNTGPKAALTAREKELVITAIEVARTKTNEPPTFHAKKAIDAGATVEEIAEVVSLCILIGGMLTYQESGKHALKAAEEYAQQLGRTARAGRPRTRRLALAASSDRE